VAVVALLSWIVVVAITRYVSLASLVAAFSLPFTAYLMLRGDDQWWMVGFGVALAVLVTLKHRANIHRLLNGTESKIGQRAEVTPETAEVR
jgi:glycerol-3-phosphate acyltransferase PlsY